MRAYAIAIGLLVAIIGSISFVVATKFMAFAEMDFTPPPISVMVTQSRLEPREQRLHTIGSLQAIRGVQVSSEASGQVTEIAFDSGDRVKKGQLLLVLNDRVEAAARESQLAALKLAQLQFTRDEKLLRKNTISQTQFDQSRSNLDQAVAQLAETEARLATKRISAPFDGVIGIREVDLGDYVSPGTLITTLQDLSEFKLDFSVPAKHVPVIAVGQAVEFQVSAFPEREFSGVIQARDAQLDINTRSLKVRARVAEQQGLLPGMFADVAITIAKPIDRVTLPETAISYSLHGNTLYIVEPQAGTEGDSKSNGGLRVRSQLVTTGQVEDGRVAILEGLEAGSSVVTTGQNKLYSGAAVVVQQDDLDQPQEL